LNFFFGVLCDLCGELLCFFFDQTGRFEAACGGTIFLDEIGATPEAIDKITACAWPGNVRKLYNVIDCAYALCSSTHIGIEDLPAAIGRSAKIMGNADLEKRMELIRTLRQTGGNRSEAARTLGVSRVTIWKQITKFGIDIRRELAVQFHHPDTVLKFQIPIPNFFVFI